MTPETTHEVISLVDSKAQVLLMYKQKSVKDTTLNSYHVTWRSPPLVTSCLPCCDLDALRCKWNKFSTRWTNNLYNFLIILHIPSDLWKQKALKSLVHTDNYGPTWRTTQLLMRHRHQGAQRWLGRSSFTAVNMAAQVSKKRKVEIAIFLY